MGFYGRYHHLGFIMMLVIPPHLQRHRFKHLYQHRFQYPQLRSLAAAQQVIFIIYNITTVAPMDICEYSKDENSHYFSGTSSNVPLRLTIR